MPIITTFLPLSSLTGIEDAYLFLDWLKKTKQQGWLQTPIHDSVFSPYKNYGIGISSYFFDTRLKQERQAWVIDREEFLNKNSSWVFDYAFFRALSEYFNTDEWWQWPDELKKRDFNAMATWQPSLSRQIEAYLDEQHYLFNQLLMLRREANRRDLILIGDLPFYIARNSPLVWANQSAFVLNSEGNLRVTSGVPAAADEPFTAQVWGHPLYDWGGVDESIILKVFHERVAFLAPLYDMIRVDHANGFFRYGVMYPAHPKWDKKTDGPGAGAAQAFLADVQAQGLGLFLENIGSETTKLDYFMKDYGLLGSQVLTLAVNTDVKAEEGGGFEQEGWLDLKNYDADLVAFSSTHDTPTLFGWLRSLPPELKLKLQTVNGFNEAMSDETLATKIRERLLKSKAKLVIIPWQDWILETLRFNIPGDENKSRWDYKVQIQNYL